MGYEYANARLRAMKSRLLTGKDYRVLVECGTLERLLTALTHTPYAAAIEATLVRGGELVAVNAAFSHDLLTTARRIRGFFEEPECSLVATALRMYDIHNVKAVLRGLQNNVPPGEIRATLLPVGDLSDHILAELAQASDPRSAIDLMVSMRLPLAGALLALRAEHPNADIPEFELALDHWYFETAFATLDKGPHGASDLREALALEADLINLLTVLRLVHTPAEMLLSLKRFRADSVREIFVGPGQVSFNMLAEAAHQASPEDTVHYLSDTPYGGALASGLEAYRSSQRLSDIERALLRYRLTWCARLMRRDPLGIGVLLGYLALKINEIGNLRWVTYGINSGLPAKMLIDELEVVDE